MWGTMFLPPPLTGSKATRPGSSVIRCVKVHLIFAPEKLQKAPSSEPLTGQHLDPPPPIEVKGQDEWEVNEILAVWLHYSNNFKHAPEQIRDFHAWYPDLPGPPKRLPEWLWAAETNEFIPDHPDDDQPLVESGRSQPKEGGDVTALSEVAYILLYQTVNRHLEVIPYWEI